MKLMTEESFNSQNILPVRNQTAQEQYTKMFHSFYCVESAEEIRCVFYDI